MAINRRRFLQSVGVLAGSMFPLPRAVRWLAQPAQSFLIPPTVHHVTENSATIYFRLGAHTQAGTVMVTRENEIVREISFATTDSLRQQIVIDGLEPRNTYRFHILVDGFEPPVFDDPDWTPLQFTTPPYDFPLRVVAVGDSGFGHEITNRLGEQMAAHDPDLFLHLGDVVYHMHEHNNDHFLNWYLKYFQPFKPLLRRMPHYPTFGNHELDSPAWLDGQPSYYWMFPPFNEDHHDGARMWYGFDFNGIQFLSLNSQLFYDRRDLMDEHNAWLDARLARDDVRYTVVFCHISPYTSSSPHQWDGIYAAEQWSPKFEANRVALVVSGHAHVYERLEVNGVHYIIAGASSDVLYGLGERLPQSKNFWSVTSYPIFDFYEDRIHLTTHTIDGDIIDNLDLALPESILTGEVTTPTVD